MIDICPTITAEEPHAFRAQMERVAAFATRLHIDLGDGTFTPNKLVPIDQVWWPGGVRADLHVMYKQPFQHLDAMIALAPQLIIVHAEAEGDFEAFATRAHSHSIETGVALLPDTPASLIISALKDIDHVLIFSGNLGHQGGSTADLKLLSKVTELKSAKPTLEIGWDGGVNADNAAEIAQGGVDVLNVGGAIHHAPDAAAAYGELRAKLAA